VSDASAAAKVVAVQAKLRFVYYFSLVQDESGWRLMSVVSRVEPNA